MIVNTRRFWIAAGATLGVVSAMLAANGPCEPRNTDGDVQALQKQVAELEARIKTLEDRLEKLESPGKPPLASLPRLAARPPKLNQPGASVPMPGFLPRNGQRPKIWGQGEINGWTFYYIPLGGQ